MKRGGAYDLTLEEWSIDGYGEVDERGFERDVVDARATSHSSTAADTILTSNFPPPAIGNCHPDQQSRASSGIANKNSLLQPALDLSHHPSYGLLFATLAYNGFEVRTNIWHSMELLGSYNAI